MKLSFKPNSPEELNMQQNLLELRKKDIASFENLRDETVQIKLIIDQIVTRGADKLFENYLTKKIPNHLSQIMLDIIENTIIIYHYPYDDNVPMYPHRAFHEDSEPVCFYFDSYQRLYFNTNYLNNIG